MLNRLFSTVSTRFKEPSSWGGIAVILTVFGLSNEESSAITNLLAAGAAAAAIFVGENGGNNGRLL